MTTNTYTWNIGDGFVAINDGVNGPFDSIALGAGITQADVRFWKHDPDDLTIYVGTERFVASGHFTDPANTIIQVQFPDGSTLDFPAELTFVGQNGFDLFDGSDGDDVVDGLGDTDALYGEAGNDDLFGNDGDDLLVGGDGNDTLGGGDGKDELEGNDGDDTLNGGAGNDSLDGGAGNDSLNGGDDNDVLIGGDGDDDIAGGDGNDIAQFAGLYSDYALTQTVSGDWDVQGAGNLDTVAQDVERIQFLDGQFDTRTQDFISAFKTKTALDFSLESFESYTSRQDKDSALEVVPNFFETGADIIIEGNTWQRVDLNYTITENTMIRFDFQASGNAEIQGFGLETNNSFRKGSDPYKLFGTQNNRHFNDDFEYTHENGLPQEFAINVGAYQAGDVIKYFTFINDNDNSEGGQSIYENIVLYEAPGEVLSFAESDFQSYTSGQDKDSDVSVSNAGFQIDLEGNTWTKVDYDYTITDRTMITFQYRTDAIGELQGFGLETNNSFKTGAQTYQLSGVQENRNFNDAFEYVPADGPFDDFFYPEGRWQDFTINVGAEQAGDVIEALTFINDDDAGLGSSSSYRNISVYEAPGDVLMFDEEDEFSAYGSAVEQGLSIAEDGFLVELDGDTSQKVAFDYTITADTVLSFQYRSTAIGDVQGIGFETDDDVATGAQSYQVFGTQRDANFDDINRYTKNDAELNDPFFFPEDPLTGEWQEFTINIGADQAGDVIEYLTFTNEDDTDGNAHSAYRNIMLYEDDGLWL